MELPDFLNFEPFNQLREKIGTDHLGQFEFFDPDIHLTGEERSKLAREGFEVRAGSIRLLSDHTLAYKNSRIVLLDKGTYHLSECDQRSSHSTWTIVTSLQALGPRSVCQTCLHQLRYKGFDQNKQRKAAYSQHLLDQFNLEDFFTTYPLYPIRSHEMTLHYLRSG